MFLIGSSGRCGTLALCDGLEQFSDHHVEHEPEPRLLREAYLKHQREDYRTPVLLRRLAFFAEHDGTAYGQSFRAPTLLDDVAECAPKARFLLLVRHPLDYARSAHGMGVLSRGDQWDRLRLMPDGSHALPLAERLVAHWMVINDYLLAFADRHPRRAAVATVDNLEGKVGEIARFLDIEILHPNELRAWLAQHPNAAPPTEPPAGLDTIDTRASDELWRRALERAVF